MGCALFSCSGDLLTASAGCGRRKSAVVKKKSENADSLELKYTLS